MEQPNEPIQRHERKLSPFAKECQDIVDSPYLNETKIREKFPFFYYMLSPNPEEHGSMRSGTVTGVDKDGNHFKVNAFSSTKVNDPLITIRNDEEKRTVRLGEKDLRIGVYPFDQDKKSYVVDIDEEGLRDFLQKAMDIYYSTLDK